VLTELHHWRALALGEDAEETKLTLQELEKAKKALALQTKQEKKAGAERARVEVKKQGKKARKDANDIIVVTMR